MNRPAANARQAGAILAGFLTGVLLLAATVPAAAQRDAARRNNVILFVGDGMDVSTVTYSRIAEHGVDGDLFMDRMPYTALSRTSSAGDLVADSAAAMSAMMTGVNTNNGVIGYPPTTERFDSNLDGDGTPLTNVAELAKSLGYAVGIVTTARVTHSTPAAVYAHVNDRGLEDDVAAQLVPGGAGYNARLGSGLDVILGGGRTHFLPGDRPDGRDLRAELQAQGYAYVDDAAGLEALGAGSRVLGLFRSSYMTYELYRGSREPGIVDMTAKAIEVLAATGRPYFLMVESGRIDTAHHNGHAFGAFVETRELDRAIGAAVEAVDLDRTLIMATADHGHVLTVAGSMVRPVDDLPYAPRSAPASFTGLPYHGIFGTAHGIDGGVISERPDRDGVPYTVLGYANGPGHREGPRVDPKRGQHTGRGRGRGVEHQPCAVPAGSDGAARVGEPWGGGRGGLRYRQHRRERARHGAQYAGVSTGSRLRSARRRRRTGRGRRRGRFPRRRRRSRRRRQGARRCRRGRRTARGRWRRRGALRDPGGDGSTYGPAGRNDVILFVGDGMGLSTVTFSRIAGHGVDGDLFLDRMPYTALSRTASADHIAGDSAAAMTAMMTGVRSSSGVIGYPPATERRDFNRDGDGPLLTNVAELAKSLGYAVGIVTTAGVTDATPAAVYAHVNDRGLENDVAAQLVPGGAGYNARLGGGLDVVFGGGRRHFVPAGAIDGEGGAGRRTDGRDLRVELQGQGYAYVWNRDGFEALGAGDRAVGLFAPGHLEYELDREDGAGGEPGIVDMTVKAIEMLAASGRPYFLMVESGRIDHAHRAGNAFRAFVETRELDRAIGAAIEAVDLDRTLIVATADHGHPLTIGARMVQPLPRVVGRPAAPRHLRHRPRPQRRAARCERGAVHGPRLRRRPRTSRGAARRSERGPDAGLGGRGARERQRCGVPAGSDGAALVGDPFGRRRGGLRHRPHRRERARHGAQHAGVRLDHGGLRPRGAAGGEPGPGGGGDAAGAGAGGGGRRADGGGVGCVSRPGRRHADVRRVVVGAGGRDGVGIRLDVLTVTPLAAGETTVTVTATDAGGSGGTATQSFRVTVPEEDVDVDVDYDADDDDLIEIATLAQLDAVRHDLDGDGVPAGAGAATGTAAPGAAAYAAAFPDAAEGMGCPGGGCLGYELVADLDFDTDGSGAADAGDAFWNGGAGWRPLGTFDEPYTAVFAGNGRTVSHLFVGGGDNAGLFGLSSGVIRGVGVVAADVTGSRCAGALAGLNGGRVEASWSTGAVTGDSCVGGLVGVNGLWVPDGGTFRPLEGFVTASWSAAEATAEQWVGGLVGYSNGTVVASYATGAVTATTAGSGAGGLVGRMGFGGNRITASYATGAVSGRGGAVGGLVGHAMPHDRVTASYWDTETSGVTRGGGGSGRTTAALQEPTGYTGPYAAWDVDVGGDGLPDAPWDFGTSGAYPALSVDADGDGAATWRELGSQGRTFPRAAASGGGAAADGATARSRAPAAFTDDPLVPEETPVRAVHLLELRARIDRLRRRAGLPAFGWTDAQVVPGVTPARATHLLELRSALGEAYAAAARAAPAYSDAVVTAGVTAMRALQLQKLRRAVVALERAP